MLLRHNELSKFRWEVDSWIQDGFFVRKKHSEDRDIERVSELVRNLGGLTYFDLKIKPFVHHIEYEEQKPIDKAKS